MDEYNRLVAVDYKKYDKSEVQRDENTLINQNTQRLVAVLHQHNINVANNIKRKF